MGCNTWKANPSILWSDVKSILIQPGVTEIIYSAFSGCPNLLDVTFPDSITSIGVEAFARCASLENIDLSMCTALTVLPDSVFEECSKLSGVKLPPNLTTIGSSAFAVCSSLPRIDLPGTATTIERAAFRNCSKLETINFPPSLTTLGERIFQACTSLPSADLSACTNLAELGGSMFSECSSLANVSLPETLTKINGGLFAQCSSLRSIDIPPGVKTIENRAFKETAITSITLPAGVTSIGIGAFENCTSLTSINIPAGVTSIGLGAFGYCSALKTLTFNSKNAPRLGEAAFMGIPTGGTLYYPAGGINYKASYFNVATNGENTFSQWTFSTGDSYPTNFDTLVEGKDIIIANKAWTGKQIKSGLKIDIIYQSNGKDATKTLTQGKDYAIIKYGANKNIGKGTISIKAEGEFSGDKALTFKIVPKTPAKFKVKAAKKSLKVSFKKVSKAQKVKTYKVEYRLSGKGAWKSKTVKAGKKATVSLTIKKLKSKKKYQVRAYAYKGAYKGYPTKTKQKKVK